MGTVMSRLHRGRELLRGARPRTQGTPDVQPARGGAR
ncbi:MAG: hypothetical protein U0Q11_25800 [Vicinamibacterales bacterium]